MKRSLCMILALLMLCPMLGACALFQKELTPISDGETEYVIVYAEDDRAALGAANILSMALRELTGVLLEIRDDSAEEQDCEFLVGATNRKASEKAKKALKDKDNAFAVAVDGKKVTLVATTDMLDLAAEMFYSSVIHLFGGSYSDGNLTLDGRLSYVHTLQAPEDSASLLAASLKPQFNKTGSLQVPADGDYRTVSGLAAYEDVLFAALGKQGGGTVICKTAANGTGTPVYSQALAGTVTSLTYDPLAKTVIALHGDGVTALNAEDMTVIHTKPLKEKHIALTYWAENNRCLLKYKDKAGYDMINGGLIQTSGTAPLHKAADALEVSDMAADSRYLYLLTRDGAVWAFDTGSTRYLPLSIPLEGGDRAVSLAVYGKQFYVGTAKGAILSLSLQGGETVAKPADLLTESFPNKVDTQGLKATHLFDTYSLSPATLGDHIYMQGGGTDGRYGYFCMEWNYGDYSNTDIHTTRIVKVDMTTNQLVKIGEPLHLGHSNDLCYNSKLNKLVVAHNLNKGNIIYYVDPDTLTITDTFTIDKALYGITYDPLTDRYVGAYGDRYYFIMDGDFNILVDKIDTGPYTAFAAEKPVTQGIDCDSKYIYSVLTGKNGISYFTVHDWSGNYVMVKILPDVTRECENIFHIGNTVYVGFNGGNDYVYRFDLTG